MSASGVVRVEVHGDTAVATLLAGCCGRKRRRTMALPAGQTPAERLATLRRMYPGAEIEFGKGEPRC